MRVTNSMMVSQLLLNVNRNLVKMSDQQDQLASGKKIRRPSDGPILASKVIKYKTDIAEMAQYDTNTRDALAWLETTEVALKNAGDILGRARDLAVQAANGTNTPDDTAKMAAEIENLRESLIATGNTTFAGRYLFSSFDTDKPLFKSDGTYNIDVGKFTLENKPVAEFEISIGERINVMTHGIDIFGTEPADNILTQKMTSSFDVNADGVIKGSASGGSYLKGPVDLTVNMMNPPTNKVNVNIDGTDYEVDVTGLDGSVIPIEKEEFLDRVMNASTNPGGIKMNTVANIYFDSTDNLVIESKGQGPVAMSEDLIGFGPNGVATREAEIHHTTVPITNADIVAEDANLRATTFTFEVNGVTQNVSIAAAPAFGAGTELADFLTALNAGVDAAFGSDVMDVVDGGGTLQFVTKGTADGTLPTLSVSSSDNFAFYKGGSNTGVQATKSKLVSPVDLTADMTNLPTNIVNITVGGTVYEMDVTGLDGTTTPIDKATLKTRIENAATNPGGILLSTVANVNYDIKGQLEIEAINYGNIKIDEDLAGYGTKGVTKEEATLSDPSKVLTNAEIASNKDDLLNSVFMINVNGVAKKVKLDPSTSFGAGTELDDFVTALNTAIDAEFGVDVMDVSHTAGVLEFTSKNTPDGIEPEISVDFTRTTESTIINDLSDFVTALNSGDKDGIQKFLGKIDDHTNKILAIRADVGARTNRMELISNRIAENTVSFTRLLSDAQDADMSEVIMYLKNAENVYKASLSIGGRVIQPTLIDFLR